AALSRSPRCSDSSSYRSDAITARRVISTMRIFGIPIFPDQASTFAKDVDALYFFIFAVSAFFALVVAVSIIYFGVRYHKTHDSEIGARIEGSLPLELLWSVIPT